jgi:hypothetical protein
MQFMDMQITKVVEDGLTIFTVTGAVSAEEIIAKAAENIAAPQTRDAMWDFSAASSIKLTTSAIEKIANTLAVHAAHIDGGKVALVASKGINIGLGKVFNVYARLAGLPKDYRTFRNRQRALEWLQAP